MYEIVARGNVSRKIDFLLCYWLMNVFSFRMILGFRAMLLYNLLVDICELLCCSAPGKIFFDIGSKCIRRDRAGKRC